MFKLKLSNWTVKAGAVVTAVHVDENGNREVVWSLKSKFPTLPTGKSFPETPAVDNLIIEITCLSNPKWPVSFCLVDSSV